MRFYTIKKDDKELVAVETMQGRIIPLEKLGINVADMNELICRYDELKDFIQKERSNHLTEDITIDSVDVLAPITVPKQDVICLGVNYREHIEETVDVIDFTKKADTVYFSKRVNRCNDPGGVIPDYDFVDSLDYEVELGVILKKDALGISAKEATDYIFGYTIINDVSARNLQLKHQQWFRGKSLDGYMPMGPCIVTTDEIDDVHDLDISCSINGKERQHSNTSHMITTVEEAIAELSQGMTLKATSIIATGTPGGVAMGMKPPVYLQKGDEVICSIKGIGKLINKVE